MACRAQGLVCTVFGQGTLAREEATIQNSPRVNEEITAETVRVIGEDGEQLGILPIEEGLAAANEADLDLVEVAPQADPPVCRVMNFGKYKYEQQKKEHAARKRGHGNELKELRLGRSIRIEQHDFDFKLKKARQILEKGARLQVFLQLRGREIAHASLGADRLREFAEALADVAKPEAPPKIERRRVNMLLVPLPNVGARKVKKSSESARAQAKQADPPAAPAEAAPAAEQESGGQTPAAESAE